ncbi:protein O-glucosyltransferase 2 isoform X1 [Hydra vulgaris]|uniref:protein O-glucosyltransferase 2 isoform X1 n=1 Tax=Hydra vulgaris TaxID=6087 RepID=UPI001F5E86B9|nr:protein O-glucosyltransferase 2 isoform X1 [Hydra vulgaris]
MLYSIIVSIIISIFNGLTSAAKVSAKNSIVFGPGLRTGFVVPVRYFYIQAVENNGKNFTKSPGLVFQVDFKSKISSNLAIGREVIDRKDGTFLVRYRMHLSYDNIVIYVTHNGDNVGNSPFHLSGKVYNENCFCPEVEKRWVKNMACPVNYQQIEKDLKPFPNINLENLIESATKSYNVAFCHYTIKKNKVYRKCYGTINDFKMFTDAWLLSVARKVKLPDVEFFTNLGDWPLTTKRFNPMPIFSWCGSNDTFDLVWPTYDLTESTLETFGGRVSLDMTSIQGNTGPSWNHKKPIAFFRGRDSRQERLDLVNRFRKNANFDVGITHYFFFKHDEEKYGPIANRVSFYDFFKYKYQLNIDGTVAAYRLPYLLAGDSVVLKQDSKYYEHFYGDLIPMKHYIPFNSDLSNLEEKVLWAIQNDEKAQKIALEGQRYARDNLLSDKLYCYTYLLLKEYAKRQSTPPTVRNGMEEVIQPKENCSCERRNSKKKAGNEKQSPTAKITSKERMGGISEFCKF